ncbi:NAD-dependent epimerase/dehydratase family protein [Inquilinus sp. KBS0705]|nr:NAD-dependent epimerase/dehydratase family protein [Inquilinus sp. KBS0705]
MKVLLLGANGRTGKQILKQLLKRRYKVSVLIRNKKTFSISSSSLTVFEGDVTDAADIDMAIEGCGAIISALNISRNNDFPWAALRTPIDFLSTTITNVIQAAHAHQIKRVLVITAWGVNETKKDIPFWFRWMIDHSNISYPYKDHERQEDLLKQSGLDWTAIRPVGLTNFAAKTVRISLNNKPKPNLLISRKSVAVFTVHALEKDLYLQKAPVISN